MSDSTKTKVTIGDVARLAGVSMSSVSNVLNDRSTRMRPATKERIQSAIRQLGYTPNLAARQLKTGHAKLIGLIVPSVANPFYGNLARYVEEAALKRGYQVMLGNSGRDAEREAKYADQLWGAGVEGIIFGTSLLQVTHLDDLIGKGMKVVAFDRPLPKGDRVSMDSVYTDNLQIMRLQIKHLASLGHKRIGFITGPIQTVSRKFRLKAFITNLKEAGLTYHSNLVWEGLTRNYGDVAAVELGREGAHELFSRPDRPTAICTLNDMYAFGVYSGARDMGLCIPDDVSVIGIDNLPLAEVVEPPLSTVEQPLKEMATAAVLLLVDRIEGNNSEPPSSRAYPPRLIVRGSTSRCAG